MRCKLCCVGIKQSNNLGQVQEAFSLIFSSAFGLDATFGGLIGSAKGNGRVTGDSSVRQELTTPQLPALTWAAQVSCRPQA